MFIFGLVQKLQFICRGRDEKPALFAMIILSRGNGPTNQPYIAATFLLLLFLPRNVERQELTTDDVISFSALTKICHPDYLMQQSSQCREKGKKEGRGERERERDGKSVSHKFAGSRDEIEYCTMKQDQER
jgi:hypothetical protein